MARFLIAGLLCAAGGPLTLPAFAQAPVDAVAEKAKEAERQRLLSDFVHYVYIQKYDLAAAMGRAVEDLNLSSRDFVSFVERSGDVAKVQDAWQRAMRVPELQEIAAKATKAFNDGKLSRARDPDEIARNIQSLTGNLRGRLLARERLLAAGEYAMPQLLNALIDTANPPLQAEVQRVMVDMGRQAVVPLGAALLKLPESHQETIAEVLGLIPWSTSLPYLSEVRDTTKSPRVREAANRAIARLGGESGTTPDLYRALAETYYAEKPEVVSFPGEEFQLLWTFDPAMGLAMTAIRTPVFHEAMAMALAERSMTMQKDQGINPDTLALWVASNFSREIDSPKGYENPAYGATRRAADYYGVAAGSEVAQRVLARALLAKDTPLARKALAAVENTAGGGAVRGDAASPLVEALRYPNRRVQYEAALAIAASQPTSPFPGSERVVPVLASTVRNATQQHAAIIANDPESYQSVRRVLTTLGYTVMPQGRSLDELATPIAEAPAVDLIVAIGLNTERFPALVEDIKGNARLAATPVLGLTTPEAYLELRNRFDAGSGVTVRQLGIGDDAIKATVSDLVAATTGGPISEDEARAYTRRSLAALRDLAVSGNTVLNVSDAALPLIGALPESQGTVKMEIAEILSRINQDRSQRAVMDAAFAAEGAERVALIAKVAQSARLFGNQLEPRHISRVLEIASKGGDAEATAAAALLGALNVPNAELLPLIVSGR